jgi:hypothetical protein
VVVWFGVGVVIYMGMVRLQRMGWMWAGWQVVGVEGKKEDGGSSLLGLALGWY